MFWFGNPLLATKLLTMDHIDHIEHRTSMDRKGENINITPDAIRGPIRAGGGNIIQNN